MELPTLTAGTNGQHLCGYILADVNYCETPLRVLLVTCKKQYHFNILANNLHDMYNTDTHTGSAVARVTNDRSV